LALHLYFYLPYSKYLILLIKVPIKYAHTGSGAVMRHALFVDSSAV